MIDAETVEAKLEARGTSVPLTITVATVQGWPAIAAAFDTLRLAAQSAGGEVIVADGSGRHAPFGADHGDSVQWVTYPGESIFQLRHRAYDLARGDIVAVTEDHVHVPPDWGMRMIAAHERHRNAAAIGGSVTNGATASVFDWATFLVVQAAVAAPIRSGPAKRLSGAVNVSYKRWALRERDDFGGLGAIDVLHQRDLASRGATMINDDSIRVAHVQPLGFRAATVINFHAGRTISGFRRRHMNLVQYARIVAAPLIPVARYGRAVWLLAPKGYGRILVMTTPAMLWLLCAQTIGQCVGYVAGEGDSPRHVQ